MDRYDIAIVGTGPAGLSAALTAKARNKNILLLGSRNLSEKIRKAEKIRNYLGLPDISGRDMQSIFLKQIENAGIEITDKKAALIYPMGDYFSLQADQDFYEASTVILAGGMVPAALYKGEQEYLGRGVSYCATCDAPLYRGKDVILISSLPENESEADFMTEFARSVTYVPLYKKETEMKPEIRVLREKPLEILGDDKVRALRTDQGEHEADGIFILRQSVMPDKLLPGLSVKEGHIEVDRSMRTNVPGCFACGDITGAPYQYMKSVGEGNVAALSAVSYIDNLARKTKQKDEKEE